MELLHGPVRPYPWGSRVAIAAVRGRPVPSDTPEAELWLGAHPAAPSTVDRDGAAVSLADVIGADPAGTLGPARRYGRLPFLLKLLAADAPLSLQAHPDAERARAGYDAEQAAGVPLDAPGRNYADPYHKPEMLCAVTDFDALCGFRPAAASAAALAALAVPALDPAVTALRDGDLRSAVTALLTLDSPDTVVAAATTAATRLAGGDATGPADGDTATPAPLAGSDPAGPVGGDAAGPVTVADGGVDPAYRLVTELAERYPGDAGVLVAVLLNRVRLRPGQAVYAPAGVLHAYLAGVGVELMAASDNVLRGGLTPKHVDVPELLRVLRFESGPPPVADPVPAVPGVDAWPTLPGIDEFAMCRARVGGPHRRITLRADGPRVLFCLTGTVVADDGTGPLTLTGGEAAFVPASRDTVTLSGFGELYQATTAG